MRTPPPQSLTAERSASAATPQPLPRPEGYRRVQAALDADSHFRIAVLAAFIIASAAGSGFGRLMGVAAWTATVLWCLTVVGLAARCVRPRNGWRSGATNASPARKAAVVTALVITRVSGIGFGFLIWRWPDDAPMVGAILAAIALLILDMLTIRRRSFAAIAAAVFVVHLGALPPSANLLGQQLPVQILAATLEFLLLSFAGFRYAQASLWKFPSATYRVAPLCIVPRLNRAWDHPVKINVV
jgi:hypothetical protein